MTTTFNRSLAFALGFGFAFLPSYGPLVGLLLLFASRLALRRSDLLWAGAALLLALPLAIHQGLSGLLFGLAQVLAPWLIYKTFSRLPGSELGNNARLLGIGLVSGLAAVVILGLWQLGMHGAPGEGPFAQAITWNADPALYGHTVLALGVLLAVLVPGAWLRLASLGLSAVGIAASGSREAAFAWLLVAGILALSGLGRSWRPKLVHLTLLGGMLLLLLVPGTMRLRAAGASLPTAASTALSPRAQAQTDELKPASEPVPTWQAAWRTFTQRPLLGWGREGGSAHSGTANMAVGPQAPAHPRNLFLQVLLQRGLLGFVGLLLFLTALGHRAAREGDTALLVAFAALLAINLFDTTLLYGGVIYPLAAVAGWRASSYQATQRNNDSTLRQLAVRLSLALADLSTVALSLLLASLLRHAAGRIFPFLSVAPPTPDIFGTVGYALLLWPIMAWREGLYPGYGLTAPQELKKQVMGAAYAGLILATGTVFFYKELPIGRSILALTVLFSMLLGPLGRALTKRLLLALGLWGRRVVVLGAGEAGLRLAAALQQRPLDGLRPVAFFDDSRHAPPSGTTGLPVLGRLAEAGPYAQRHGIHHAIVAATQTTPAALTGLLGREGRAFQRVQIIPEIAGLPVYGVSASSPANLLALEVRNELNYHHNRILKRLLDLTGVIIGGLLISPLIALLALAIILDSPGPAFFGHRRLGQNGKHFTCWKFRTMVPDAQERLEATLATNPQLREEWQQNQKLQNDPRVTRVGRFLRRTSLDELPQLWNVLKGEMSLVGPRPIVDDETHKYGEAYELYKMVRPGMAGYWQVRGRSDTDYDQRVELDSFYVRNWSVWLDIAILSEVPGIVLAGRGAY